MTSAFAGIPLLARIAVRTGWPIAVAWVAGLVSLFLVTGLSMAALYDTPESVAAYGSSLGEAMVMLNGRVAGLDTFGGLMMNEFASIISFAIPIMAIGLTARTTRKDEETGRSELLLAGRVGRLAPTAAALVVVATTFAMLGLALWVATLPLQIDRGGAALYTASIIATGWVYAAGTAVLAQVVAHSRTLWAIAMAAAGATLLTRGIGDVNENWLSWTSPLGWHGLVRPFGDATAVPLLVAVLASAVLAAIALWLAGRRDVGQGMVASRTGPATATRWRSSRAGAAVHQHLGAATGWTIGAVALMAMYGGVLDVAVEAILSTPALTEFLVDADTLVDAIAQMLVAFAGFLGAGFALQTLGGLRGEETSGRLEFELTAGRHRWSWLAAHTAVAVVGATLVVLAGSAAFALSASLTLDDPGLAGRLVTAAVWQVPAAVVFAGLSVALFGVAPRLQALAWTPFVLAVVVTLMGPTLQLTDAQMRWSPFGAVGTAPNGPVAAGGVVTLLVVTAVLTAIGMAGFRRRDVPRT